MDEITILQAETLRTLANPRRIQILHAVAGGPTEVGRLAREIGASQPNVSQHLAALRRAGLVEAERDGRGIRFQLADPDVIVASGLMRAVLERRLTRLGQVVANATSPLSTVAAAAVRESPPSLPARTASR